jgi:hypothetical protein
MFEITAEHISLLREEDLRTLVGLLCESEARRLGASPAHVYWGGHQNASDGGLDVCVMFPVETATGGFVPSPFTGFQVKKQDISGAKITREMRPHGILRSSIKELAAQSGAYIIVSSKASTSFSSLMNRRDAMARAIEDLSDRSKIQLDFYDANKVSTWVREHPGLIPWVREKIGKAIPGWRSYGSWARPTASTPEEYLLDDKIRLFDARCREHGVQVLDGIRMVRASLGKNGGVVRLVGLSGVGKTHFAQALFDKRVGEVSLDPSLAIYTNMGDDPHPQPTAIASDLLATNKRAILVIDNCLPELHRRLSDVCRSSTSQLSVLTIEYDITDDQLEDTERFELLPSSKDLLIKVLERRYPELSAIDVKAIAEFSGGNARIAIALAATVETNESISNLKDEELFQRLFHQRHSPNESLLLAAQAFALIYSFDGENVSAGGELETLGSMVGKDQHEMYRCVAELRRRELVQARSHWRAVLPPAIGNRLAKLAIQNIPQTILESTLLTSGNERLLRSFSRRLQYLHDSREAVSIVSKWIAADGLLGNPAELDELHEAMLCNVSSVAPEAALAALERGWRVMDGQSQCAKRFSRYLALLRSLAYDPELFDRSATLIGRIASCDGESKGSNSGNVFKSMFVLYFSGTHAGIEQRLGVIEHFLSSSDEREMSVGLLALEAAMEAWHFSSSDDFKFGARSRDFGYWPSSTEEVCHWFNATLCFLERCESSYLKCAQKIRGILAEKFRGIWLKSGAYDELERVCISIAKRSFWPEGWSAVKETQYYHARELSNDEFARLALLESGLRPIDLVQKARTFVFSRKHIELWLDSEDGGDIETKLKRVEATAEQLGRSVAFDEQAFAILVPDMVTSDAQLWSFAAGLAKGARDPRGVWNTIVKQFSITETGRNPEILRGFVAALNDVNAGVAGKLLDEAVYDDVLGPIFPLLQSTSMDERCVQRLIASLRFGRVPIEGYRQVAYGRATASLSVANLEKLLAEISTKAKGFQVAAEILWMRIQGDSRQADYCSDLAHIGRELLRNVQFEDKDDRGDHVLGEIVRSCLVGDQGDAVARDVCRKLRSAIAKYNTHAYYHGNLLRALCCVQPFAVLDEIVGVDEEDFSGKRFIDDISFVRGNPLNVLPAEIIVAWCEKDSSTRYPIAASAVTPFERIDHASPTRWTNTALLLLDRAPDRVEVLKQFVCKFTPSSWSGSRAEIIEQNAKLLDLIDQYPDPVVRQFVTQEKNRFAVHIKQARELDDQMDRHTDERFE